MQIGKILHQIYRVDQFLGEGGPSIVYKGTDTLLGLPVAIKQLKQEDGNQLLKADRFLREARTQARLTHPHIVSIKAVFENEDGYFIVMEYVDGTDLEHLIANSRTTPRLPIEQISQIFGELLDALYYAHKAGVIHRDIKPANVMLTREGKVKLADFGIARSEHEEKLTKTGVLIGTPAYLPPEQLHGKELDQRSDIYSVGAAIFESIAGFTPFETPGEERTIHQILKDHLFSPPPSLRKLGFDIPEALDDLVQKCLAKTQEERPNNCKELRKTLLTILPSVPTGSSDYLPAMPPYQAPLPTSGHPTLPKEVPSKPTNETYASNTEAPSSNLKLWLPLSLLIVLLGGGGLWWFRPQTTQPNPPVRTRHTAEQVTKQRSRIVIPPPNKRVEEPAKRVEEPAKRVAEPPKRAKEPSRRTPPTKVVDPVQRREPTPPVAAKVPTPRPPAPVEDLSPPSIALRRGEMVKIPAGEFTQGNPLDSAEQRKRLKANPHPKRSTYLSAFWLDRFEVTIEKYRTCVDAGACERLRIVKRIIPGFPGRSIDLLRTRPRKEPVRWIRFEEAQAYCKWAGKRLPTEAEWEKAARGTDGRTFPWGNVRPQYCRLAKFYGCERDPYGSSKPGEVATHLRPDGQSPYRVYDMAGNVFEWVQDCYDPVAYKKLPQKDPVHLVPACKERVIRGGSYRTFHSIRTYRRYGEPATSRQADIGFRCAWSANKSTAASPLTPTPKRFRDDK
ncbi:MAG: SUMF1/EgtB/PvdO family nonheme iron enzyme [Myxococcales bacterium]|nr:SUMF1/EgtB/PvdO family nonheme iron enzyme [Myxococcales bacterium]